MTDIERAIIAFYEDQLLTKLMNILEVGSGWGMFTRVATEYGHHVTTIDKIPDPRDFKANTDGMPNITRHIGSSLDIVPKLKEQYDFIFIDGDHGYQGCLKDINLCWPLLKDGGTLMIDDIWHVKNWPSEYGVARAVAEFILKDRKHVITIYPVGHGVGIIEKL